VGGSRPDYFILDNGDLYPRLYNDVDHVVHLFFLKILVLVFLVMLLDYFNGCVRATLGLKLKL
jgi:hypothetical protein